MMGQSSPQRLLTDSPFTCTYVRVRAPCRRNRNTNTPNLHMRWRWPTGPDMYMGCSWCSQKTSFLWGKSVRPLEWLAGGVAELNDVHALFTTVTPVTCNHSLRMASSVGGLW